MHVLFCDFVAITSGAAFWPILAIFRISIGLRLYFGFSPKSGPRIGADFHAKNGLTNRGYPQFVIVTRLRISQTCHRDMFVDITNVSSRHVCAQHKLVIATRLCPAQTGHRDNRSRPDPRRHDAHAPGTTAPHWDVVASCVLAVW